MALIKCMECGKEISDSATSCPHCGYKTTYGQKEEATQVISRISIILNLIGIAVDIIGAFLFFKGISQLNEYGYGLFDDWAGSYLDAVVEAGRRSVTGIVLVLVGFVGAILYKKCFNGIMTTVMSDATSSASGADEEPDDENAISGRCELCDTQGTTFICRIPDLPGKHELCQECIDEYMAQIDASL